MDKTVKLTGSIGLVVLLMIAHISSRAQEQGSTGASSIEYVASLGGIVSASVSQSNLVFIAQRDMIRVLDISDSKHSKEVGSLKIDGIITSIIAFKPALYVTTHGYGTSLGYSFVIDTTAPTSMKITKMFSRGERLKMVIRGQHLRFDDDQGHKTYYNISNPLNPTLENISESQANTLFTNGSKDNQAQQINNTDQSVLYRGLSEAIDIKIDGTWAYVLDRISGLNVFDISIPYKPKFISDYKLSGNPLLLNIRENRAFVADVDESVVHIFDISHPEKINIICSVSIPGLIKGIDGDSNYIYVVTEKKVVGLQIYDYSLPSSPHLLTTFNQGSWCNGFIRSDNTGYLLVEDNFLALNLTNPRSPVILGKYWPTNLSDKHTFINRICVSGKRIYSLGDHEGERCVRVLDVSNPSSIKMISEYSLEYYKYHGIAASKSCFYLIRDMSNTSGSFSYLDFMDYDDLSGPKYIEAHEAYLQSPGGIATCDNWIYVADENGVAIFRVNK